MNLALPLHFDHRGRTAETGDERYVRDLIETVLFTAPGERVMRPEFGSGVLQLLFAPNSPELAGATEMLVQSALTRWLSEAITVVSVRVEAHESELRVTVVYTLRGDDRQHVQVFVHGAAS
jgi:phage baseplate assembly protein W